MIKKQSDFPLIKEYAKKFKITPETIFAYYPDIYTNYKLTPDLLIHEERHLAQQKKIGLDVWVENFLNDPKKRLAYEIDAYQTQLRSIADREHRNKIRIDSAKHLSSPLYGNIVSEREAFLLLKV